MTATEYVVLVDKNNQELGLAEKLIAHQNNLLHRAFSVFIFRKRDQLELLIQKRAHHKYHCAGLWSNTCCSHPRANEAITDAGERRLQEELGISAKLTDLGWFYYNAHFDNGLSEHEIDHVLVGLAPNQTELMINAEEIAETQWINLTELNHLLAKDPSSFTPWFAQALSKIPDNIFN